MMDGSRHVAKSKLPGVVCKESSSVGGVEMSELSTVRVTEISKEGSV